MREIEGISVIIPTKNRAELLNNAILSLLDCQYSCPYEILIIDNGSTDNTKEVVQRLSSDITIINYYYEDTPGLHVGRHKGMLEASFDILVFLDDDVIVHDGFLQGVYDSYTDESVVLVGGNNFPLFQEEPPKWLLRLWKKSKYKDIQLLSELSIIDFNYRGIKEISPFFIWGCNFSITKDVLLECGGFHPDGMPKDSLEFRGDGETSVSHFVFSKGYKALYNSNVSVSHTVTIGRMKKGYFVKRSFNQGISDSYSKNRIKYGIQKNDDIIANLDAKSRERRHFYVLIKDYIRISRLFLQKAMIYSLNPFLWIRMKLSYYKGMRFHHKCLERNEELIKWVVKEKYF